MENCYFTQRPSDAVDKLCLLVLPLAVFVRTYSEYALTNTAAVQNCVSHPKYQRILLSFSARFDLAYTKLTGFLCLRYILFWNCSEPNREGRIPEKGRKKANAISERDASGDARAIPRLALEGYANAWRTVCVKGLRKQSPYRGQGALTSVTKSSEQFHFFVKRRLCAAFFLICSAEGGSILSTSSFVRYVRE